MQRRGSGGSAFPGSDRLKLPGLFFVSGAIPENRQGKGRHRAEKDRTTGGVPMKILRSATEDEMVLSFLQRELDSPRFREPLKEELKAFGEGEELIRGGDFGDAGENRLRRQILDSLRGYPDRGAFEGLPRVIDWQYAAMDREDLEKLRYPDDSRWNKLSGGTSEPVRAAEILRALGPDLPNDPKGPAGPGKAGTFPPMILLTGGGGRCLILDGSARATAYAAEPERFDGAEAYVGFCPAEALRRRNPLLYRGMNCAYLLRCSDGSLYAGWTNCPEARLKAHNEGRGSRYTRSRLPVRLVYTEFFEDRHEALSREWHLKHMTKQEKEELVRRRGMDRE